MQGGWGALGARHLQVQLPASCQGHIPWEAPWAGPVEAAAGPSPSGPGPTVPGAELLWGPMAPGWGVSVDTGQSTQGDHRHLQGQPLPPSP